MPDTQLRIGMIGVSGRGGLWRHWHQPAGRPDERGRRSLRCTVAA